MLLHPTCWMDFPLYYVIASLSFLAVINCDIQNIQGFLVNSISVALNSSAVLKCDGGELTKKLTWHTPSMEVLSPGSTEVLPPSLHYRLDDTGTLTVLDVARHHAGFYWCSTDSSLTNTTVWHLMIDPLFRFHLEMESITYGWYAGLGALVVGITVGLMKIIVKICCPQCHARASAAARVQQMRQLIVSLETYRNDQSVRLRDHYNAQVDKVKESCSLQMENLRDHYATKIARFRNYRLPFCAYREQYWQQASKVRDYSSIQMERLQENYTKNLAKLRSYSVIQLERFRLQYQLQHKHMAKILEALNFNLESCRTGPSGTITPNDDDPGGFGLNMELSLAHLQMNSGLNYEESDSITIGPNQSALVVQVECNQEGRVASLSPVSEHGCMVTPPNGGVSLEEGEAVGSAARDREADLLTERLIERLSNGPDVAVHDDSPV